MTVAPTLPRTFTLFEKFSTFEKNSYRYWRLRILYSTILGYAAYYLLRQNFSMAMPGMMDEFGYSKQEMGMIVTVWSVIYGLGKFLNGYLSDRSNARYFMAFGLLSCAMVSVAMGFANGLMLIGALWALSGWFQSMGWPPSARMLTHWFSPSELGTKWGLCASSHQIGGAATLILSGFLIEQNYGWRSVFWVPAIIAVVASFFLLNRLRDTPSDVGLPPVEEYKGDVADPDGATTTRITPKEVWVEVFQNRLVWFVAIANMCLYVPRMGIFVWAPTFLKEFKGVSLLMAGTQTAGFEIAGLFGGIFAGWVSDKAFKGQRGPAGALFLVLSAVALVCVWKIPAGHPLLDTIALMCAGFLIYGPQVLAGVAIADFVPKRAVGVATGFAGACAYGGSAISGVGVGGVVQRYGWDAGFMLFTAAALLGACFFGLAWKHRVREAA